MEKYNKGLMKEGIFVKSYCFYYVVNRQGNTVLTKIYTIKENYLEYLGDFYYPESINDAVDENCVFKYLVKIGKIPERYLKSSLEYGVEGLFLGKVTEIYTIKCLN